MEHDFVVKKDLFHGIDAVKISSSSNNAECVITLWGANVVSWKNDGEERLYLSPKARFDETSAIRGGIPVVFPQFGRPSDVMPQHGFARTMKWEFHGFVVENNCCTAEFQLQSSENTLSVYPHHFLIKYFVSLSHKKLFCSFIVENTGKSDVMRFQILLHSYLQCSDIENATVCGFDGCSFRDKLKGESECVESISKITFTQETDRIYLEPSSDIILSSRLNGDIQVHSFGVLNCKDETKPIRSDVVLWNPWVNKTLSIADFASDSFQNFVCVEPGLVRDYFAIASGESCCFTQQLSII